jgi:hypothetical protein
MQPTLVALIAVLHLARILKMVFLKLFKGEEKERLIIDQSTRP